MSKVLIIEGDLFLSKFYSIKLKKLKHEVDTALNGHEALEKLKMQHYDAVLMDVILPYRDGFELLKDMKRFRKKLRIKVIASELQQKADIKKAFELGATLYFIKSESQTYDIIDSIQSLLTNKPLPTEHGVKGTPEKKKTAKKAVSKKKTVKKKSSKSVSNKKTGAKKKKK